MNGLTKRILGIALVVFASVAWIADAEARRLGGGKSIGRQSNVTQRQATPPAAAPTQGSAAQAGAAARSGNRWMAPIAGLAAGLGLAALASWLGFGEELANFMMIALLVIAAIFLFRMFAARRQAAQGGHGGGPRHAYEGGYPGAARQGDPSGATHSGLQRTADRPLGGSAAATASAGAVAAADGIPAGFDVNGFLRTAKVQFVRLQAANDAGDLNDLREFTSPEMFAELKLDIDDRAGAANRTDVVTLDAELLGIETTAVDHVASVRFHGMIRDAAEEAQPFDEVWVLTRPVTGAGGWVLAGITQRL